MTKVKNITKSEQQELQELELKAEIFSLGTEIKMSIQNAEQISLQLIEEYNVLAEKVRKCRK